MTTWNNSSASRQNIFFLLLTDFDDSALTDSVRRLRQQGRPVLLVGTSRHPVRGRSGIHYQVDLSLGDVTATDAVSALIVLSDRRLAGDTFTDPRIGRLISAVLQEEAAVIVTPAVALALGGDSAESCQRFSIWHNGSTKLLDHLLQ